MAVHPEPHILLPTASHRNTLILLHGTSMTGPVFASHLLPTALLPPTRSHPQSPDVDASASRVTLPERFPHCRFVFPTGAPRKTTVFGAKETNAWFDITDFGDRTSGEAEMLGGLRESSLSLAALVKEEIELLYRDGFRGEEKGRLILLGFSQGAAMGSILLLGGEMERLGASDGLGGFVGLSGWLPFRRQIEAASFVADGDLFAADGDLLAGDGDLLAPRARAMGFVRELLHLDAEREGRVGLKAPSNVPVFLGHGELDPKVRLEWGQQSRDTLHKLGMHVESKVYRGRAHWWTSEEMGHVAEFLAARWDLQ
ncbi:unnamed protein product [Diplocarpon coronariae]